MLTPNCILCASTKFYRKRQWLNVNTGMTDEHEHTHKRTHVRARANAARTHTHTHTRARRYHYKPPPYKSTCHLLGQQYKLLQHVKHDLKKIINMVSDLSPPAAYPRHGLRLLECNQYAHTAEYWLELTNNPLNMYYMITLSQRWGLCNNRAAHYTPATGESSARTGLTNL
jgi:hypothetical protein